MRPAFSYNAFCVLLQCTRTILMVFLGYKHYFFHLAHLNFVFHLRHIAACINTNFTLSLLLTITLSHTHVVVGKTFCETQSKDCEPFLCDLDEHEYVCTFWNLCDVCSAFCETALARGTLFNVFQNQRTYCFNLTDPIWQTKGVLF